MRPSSPRRAGLYVCADTVTVRAALRSPAAWGCRATQRATAGDDPAVRADALVRLVGRDSAARSAIELASPALADALAAAADRMPGDIRRQRALTASLTAYLLRMTWRPTPFGLFAGVALGTFGQPVAGVLRDLPRATLRPDAGWLADVTAALERDPAVPLPRVRVATAPGVVRHHDRFTLARPSPGGSAAAPPEEVHLAATPLVTVILQAAADGVGCHELAARLAAASPRVPEARFRTVLRELISCGLLITDLMPPPGDADPVGHMLAALGRPEPPDAGGGDISGLRARLRVLSDGQARLCADTVLDAAVRLPAAVACEAELAVETGWRCASALEPGEPAMRAYRQAFVERYGHDRLIRLPELLDEVTGLGPPGEPACEPPGERPDPRDDILLELAAGPGAGARAEVVLDDNTIGRLTPPGGPLTPEVAPPSLELHAQLIASSAAELASGRFLLAVSPSGGSLLAGASLGRLAATLGPEVRGCAFPPPGDDDGTGPVYAEVAFRPNDPRLGNVVHTTGWVAHRIPVGLADARPGDLRPADLAVYADPGGLRLFSLALGRDVVPVCYSMLRRELMPPAARLLLAIGAERFATWRPWRWGPARRLPYRPRVLAGRTILSPANWNIPAALRDLATARPPRAGRAAGQGWRDRAASWQDAVHAWRESAGAPRWLLAGQDDLRLPLDTDDPAHLELLWRECRRNPRGVLTELPGGHAGPRSSGWLTGPDGPHVAEVVFPLFRRPGRGGVGHTTSRQRQPPTVHLTRPSGIGWHPPGGEWLYVKIYVPPRFQDDVLASARAQLAPVLLPDAVDRWFLVRYRDQDPAGGHHLRLRFHGNPAHLMARLLPAVHGWTRGLRAAGWCGRVTLDTYEPEIERYGRGPLMAAAERAFAADSACVLDLLATPFAPQASGQEPRAEQIAAASLTLLATLLADTDSAGTRSAGSAWLAEWLPDIQLSRQRRALASELRHGTLGLLAPGGCRVLTDAWRGSAPVIRAYWHQVLATLPAEKASRIGADLIHLHGNRLLGGGYADPGVAWRLARQTAGSWQATGLRART